VQERLWFSLLGPVRAWRGPDEVDLGSPQQRAALAALLLREGAQASVDELIDAVWGEDAPRSAEKAIRTYVYRLRRALDPAGVARSAIATVGNGYVMRVAADECDLAAFRAELTKAEGARRSGDLVKAAGHLRAALALWQGTPLAGIQGVYADVQRATLDRLRRSAIEARLTLDFQLGEFGKAVVELTSLVAESPLDERFRELLMLALYRSGRQAEALAAYREGQALLADELGIDPGPDLRSTYERILRADPALVEQPAVAEPVEPTPLPVPAQLPADLAAFTGRETELALLDGLLSDSATLVTAVIAGMAGVGKTTLAVHWAHQVAPRFPDGQLYVNLRGFEPTGSAMTAGETMRAVLDSLGVPPQAVPASVDAQTALYRSLLAGRRVLILADNARDADQVRPLLPGTPGCLVIVTSRTQLPSLIAADGARPVSLDLLPSADALAFLTNRLGTQRLAAEPDATRKIIDHCAGLPLALAIVAARAAIHPNFSLASIAAELRDSHGSLDAFTVADTTIDVRDVFSWSYHMLPPEAARLFRLLALHPGPDIATPAVASLVGMPVRAARSLLGTLTRSHLLIEHVPGRFSSHDLLRAYATELTGAHDSEAERHDALGRMLDHYLHTAFAASALFSPNRERIPLGPPVAGAVVEELADADAAVAWFSQEQSVLLAVVKDAFARGFDAHCWQLAWTTALFLDSRGHWLDLLVAQHTGLDAADRSGDKYGQAVAHRALGRANGDLSRFDAALKHLWLAFDLFGEVGDVRAQANIHRQFSWTLEQRGADGDLTAALDHACKSLELHRKSSDTHGQAAALNAVGWYHGLLGQYSEALEHCEQALALMRETGDRYGQADTWDSIGYAHMHLGHHDEAADSYRHAIDLYRQLGVTFAEAETSRRLGDTLMAAGDRQAAIAAWTTSLAMLDQLRHPLADEVRALLAAAEDTG
jgi:DNA-binding SARP family transcriptional activator